MRTLAIIFISEKHDIQIRYENEGNCGVCDRYTWCINLLWDYAQDLGLTKKN